MKESLKSVQTSIRRVFPNNNAEDSVSNTNPFAGWFEWDVSDVFFHESGREPTADEAATAVRASLDKLIKQTEHFYSTDPTFTIENLKVDDGEESPEVGAE